MECVLAGLLDDIFQFGSLVQRVAKGNEQPDYLADLEEMAELSDQRDEILSRVSSVITQVDNSAGCASEEPALH